ncbi:hypothetical protein ABEO79_00060 [Micromonospora provocatoris]
MEQIIQDHERRITNLETQLTKIESSQIKIENTIMSEAKETREAFDRQNNRMWDMMKQIQESNDAKAMRKDDLKKTSLEKGYQFLMVIAGSGSIIYVLIQAAVKAIGGK